MESEWKSLIAWFCLGLFAMAELGNVEMGSELGRMCSLIDRTADREVADICANRVADDNYMQRLEARQARRE